MKKILLILFLIASFMAQAQGHIGSRRFFLKAEWKHFQRQNKLQDFQFVETDSTLSFSISDTSFEKTGFLYFFDRAGFCVREEITSPCGTCAENRLQCLLSDKNYGWISLGDDTWVSKYSKKRLLKIEKIDNIHRQSVIAVYWNKAQYRQITDSTGFTRQLLR